jgi:hypothetical protein
MGEFAEGSYIQTPDGMVLIGDGHGWTAVRYAGQAGYISGSLRIKKGRLTSAGTLYVTTTGDTAAFMAAIARISDKKCVFE